MRRWGTARQAELGRHLSKYSTYFATSELCVLWAEIRTAAFRRGRPIDVADAWIASTALALGAPMVTNNPEDFSMVVGLEVLTTR